MSLGDGGTHGLDCFGVAASILGGDAIGDGGGAVIFEHVWGRVCLGEELFTHGRRGGGGSEGATLDRKTLGVDDIGEEGETATGLLLRNIFSEGLFDNLGGGNLDGRFALARIPKTLVRLCVKVPEGDDVSFHGLVLAEREGEDEEERGGENRENREESKEARECPSNRQKGGGDEKITELTEPKRPEELVVCLDVLRDFILRHIYYTLYHSAEEKR